MAISGTTNTCQITTNTQFELSGLTQTNLSTINITDENGLDVSECFGIETNIITVQGDNITLSGECDTSLEIVITDGVSRPVECDFTRFTQDGDGFLTFFFSDNSSSDNIHPECCTALGFTPEINDETCYFVCRWRDELDPEDCDNYSPTNEQTVEGWEIFEYAGGGEVTTVPSAQCCYAYEWVEEIQANGDIKCVIDVPFDPCGGLQIVEPIPDFGLVSFLDTETNTTVTTVPNSECCTSNGLSFQIIRGGFECFNTLVGQQPSVTLLVTNPCCEPTDIVDEPICSLWRVTNNSFTEPRRFDYSESLISIDCSPGENVFFVDISPRTTVEICVVLSTTTIESEPNLTFVKISDFCSQNETP